MRILLHVVFWLTLTVWITLVVAPGLTGMTAFGALQDQEVSVARYADYFAGQVWAVMSELCRTAEERAQVWP